MSLWLVEQAVSRQTERSLTSELMVTGQVFQQLLAEREDRLTSNSVLLTGDFALKRALATYDPATLATVAVNYRARSGVDLLWILDEAGRVLADAAGREPAGTNAAERPPIATARATGKPAAAIAAVGDGLVQLVAVPVLGPDMIGLLVLGTNIDDATARDLEARTGSSVSFLTADRLFASSWDAATRGRLVLPALGAGEPFLSKLPNGRHLSLLVPVAASLPSPLHALVQRSWDEALAPFRSLRRRMVVIGLGALLLALGVGVVIAHGVTAPIGTLVTGMREVLRGNLEHRVEVTRQDEIGFLATSFNEMTGGLAERARIRAMIDKVVSPEVAHELLAGGMALGGELREVTVLFADLRDSTALGERLTPTALLELLNAFLSRMAKAIEQERGIVDKYVGDEIMAVFGAPLDLPGPRRARGRGGRRDDARARRVERRARPGGAAPDGDRHRDRHRHRRERRLVGAPELHRARRRREPGGASARPDQGARRRALDERGDRGGRGGTLPDARARHGDGARAGGADDAVHRRRPRRRGRRPDRKNRRVRRDQRRAPQGDPLVTRRRPAPLVPRREFVARLASNAAHRDRDGRRLVGDRGRRLSRHGPPLAGSTRC